ncbi:MAG TPA: sigma 54-interacting transcriptional regulator [Candidatus Ozemobacteraceae bacterium]|nr:sigma 54-interacting transcriptional regulator [Candidatus Ozemobacteraceae bacterium]
MKKPLTLMCTPTPEAMLAAAVCWKKDTELVSVGSKWINEALAKIPADASHREIIILLDDVAEPETTRKHLRALMKRGITITWFGSTRYERLQKELVSVKGLSFVLGKGVLNAVLSKYQPSSELMRVIKAYQGYNEDLFHTLNYFKTRFMMNFDDPRELQAAIEFLHSWDAEKFSIGTLPPVLREAITNFREADFPYIEGKSERVLELKKRILQVANTDLSALILGETGTGKEAVAFFLHDFSTRRGKPFVAINCAGLDETFLRSELFGHKRGAFTGAISDHAGLVKAAHGGTLFLDEVTEMPPAIQADLLRFLQNRRFRPLGQQREEVADVRLVAAAQPSLYQKLREGSFRSDLFFRLNEVDLKTMPLREIPDDIMRVVSHLVFRLYRKHGINIPETLVSFEQQADAMRSYSWPGNVRELYSLVRQHGLLKTDILASLQQSQNLWSANQPSPANTFSVPLNPIRPLDRVRAEYVQSLVNAHPDMTRKSLAQALEIAPNTLAALLRNALK